MWTVSVLPTFKIYLFFSISHYVRFSSSSSGPDFYFYLPSEYTSVVEDYLRCWKPGKDLRLIKNPSGKVFVQPMGKRNYTNITRTVARDILKFEDWGAYSSHSHRRSAATILANDGMSAQEMMRMGRWKNESIVMEYIQNSDDTRKKMVSSLSGVGLETEQDLMKKAHLKKNRSSGKTTPRPRKTRKLEISDDDTVHFYYSSDDSLLSDGDEAPLSTLAKTASHVRKQEKKKIAAAPAPAAAAPVVADSKLPAITGATNVFFNCTITRDLEKDVDE